MRWLKQWRERRSKKVAIQHVRALTWLYGQYLQTMTENELKNRAANVAQLLTKPRVNLYEAEESFLRFGRALRDIQLIIDD